ncbi:peptidoglycan-recognition protein SC2-like [Branchiostoma floridae x Branchiostoma belcheri]
MKFLCLVLLCVPACVLCESACDRLNLVSRADWGAKPPRARTPLSHPVGKLVIHHSDGYWRHLSNWGGYTDQEEYMARVREIQEDHMEQGWDDIGYNFLIDGFGNVYVGRGWDNVGAHAPCCNSDSIGINFLGYFEDELPTREALKAGKDLIACWNDLEIGPHWDFGVRCHSDVGAASGETVCPGAALCDYAKRHFPFPYDVDVMHGR